MVKIMNIKTFSNCRSKLKHQNFTSELLAKLKNMLVKLIEVTELH